MTLPKRVLIEVDSYNKQFIRLNFYDEKRERFDSYQLPAHAISVVGNAVVLFNKYDPDQFWLPCCAVVLAKSPATDEERENEARQRSYNHYYEDRHNRQHDLQQMARRVEAPFYRVRDEETEFYKIYDYHDHGVNQRFLPFEEIRQVTDGREYHLVKDTWDKMGAEPPPIPEGMSIDDLTEEDWEIYGDDRPMLELPVSGGVAPMVAWLLANISGRFYVKDAVVVFERYADWLHARMRFSGECE